MAVTQPEQEERRHSVGQNLCWNPFPHSKRHLQSDPMQLHASHGWTAHRRDLRSRGLFCFDMDGKQLWRKDLGPLDAGWYVDTNTSWGFGTSPVLHDGKVLVQCELMSEQFIATYDAKDGHELWRTARKDVPTWSTPWWRRSMAGLKL